MGRSRFAQVVRPAAALAVAAAVTAAVVGAPPALAAAPAAGSDTPAAHVSGVLNVRDEGRLRYITTAGEVVIDEGRAMGSVPGSVKVRFLYDGEPTVSARFTISASHGSIDARATARLSSLTSASPSFRGTMTITGGSGRYAHVHGRGELYGVYYRRSYGLTVQAIAKLTY